MSGKGSLPPSGTIFDGRNTINGQPAPFGNMDPFGHMSTYWPDEGHYSWDNPGQTNGHWSTHTPNGVKPGKTPPGGKVG